MAMHDPSPITSVSVRNPSSVAPTLIFLYETRPPTRSENSVVYLGGPHSADFLLRHLLTGTPTLLFDEWSGRQSLIANLDSFQKAAGRYLRRGLVVFISFLCPPPPPLSEFLSGIALSSDSDWSIFLISHCIGLCPRKDICFVAPVLRRDPLFPLFFPKPNSPSQMARCGSVSSPHCSSIRPLSPLFSFLRAFTITPFFSFQGPGRSVFPTRQETTVPFPDPCPPSMDTVHPTLFFLKSRGRSCKN